MSTLASPLSIAGTRQSGASVRTQNGKKTPLLTTAAALCRSRRGDKHVVIVQTYENIPEENLRNELNQHSNFVHNKKMQLNKGD